MTTRVYGTTDAAAYLGISVDTLKYHIYNKQHLAPDQTVGRELVFYQATLDEFKRKHQTEGFTLAEAVEFFDVPLAWLRKHLYYTKRLKPDGKRRTQLVFKSETLERLIAEEGHPNPGHQPDA